MSDKTINLAIEEESNLENICTDICHEIIKLNPGQSLKIKGFKDPAYLRDFEAELLGEMIGRPEIENGTYHRTADELNLTYIIKVTR